MSQDDWYDVMQVCTNGHEITAFAVSQPSSRRPFCESCGAETILTCPTCNRPLRGYRHISGVVGLFDTSVPPYCADCGSPYPWQQSRMTNVVQVLQEAHVSEADLEIVTSLLPDISRETPKTDIASLKVRAIINRISDEQMRKVVVKAITRIASESAIETMSL